MRKEKWRKENSGKEHWTGGKGPCSNSSCVEKIITAPQVTNSWVPGAAGLTITNQLNVSISVLQVGKLSLKDVKGLGLGHPASEYQKQGSNPGLAAPKPEPWNCNLYEALTVRCK